MDDVTPSKSGSEPNPYYAEAFLNKFLKNKMAFLPWWSGLLSKEGARACNSHVEGYFNTIKSVVRRNRHTIGNMPAKSLRVMKVLRKRTAVSIHKQVKFKIPKRRLATRTKKRKAQKNSDEGPCKKLYRTSSFSDDSSCSNASIFESKDTEISYSQSQKTNEKWFKKSKNQNSPSYFSKNNLINLKNELSTISEEPTDFNTDTLTKELSHKEDSAELINYNRYSS